MVCLDVVHLLSVLVLVLCFFPAGTLYRYHEYVMLDQV